MNIVKAIYIQNQSFLGFYICLFVLVFAPNLHLKAQTQKAKQRVTTQKTLVKKQQPLQSVLFEITKHGLAHKSYLMGTLHLVCASDWQPTPRIEELIGSVYSVFLEIDISKRDYLEETAALVMLKGDSLNSQFISEDKYQQMSKIAKDSLRISLRNLQKFSPITLSSVILLGMLNCKMTMVDEQIAKIASKKSRNLFGLETVKEQFTLLNSVSKKEQMEEIYALLINLTETKKELNALQRAYLQDNLSEIEKLMDNSKQLANAGFADDFLIKRNLKWLQKLKPQLNTEATFIAVGAGHLVGEKGLVNLLKKEGYQVKPIEYKERLN